MKFLSAVSLLTVIMFVCGATLEKKHEAKDAVAGKKPYNSDVPATESKGFFQSITDTVKEYTINKALDMFKTMPVECKSKINKSGKLIATKNGKIFCEKKCLEIYDKIDNVRKTIDTIKSYLPFAQKLKLKRRPNQNLLKFKCSRNLTGTKLICNCPQAPQFNFGKSLKTYLEKTFLKPSTVARHKHHYPPPYYNGYGYGPYNGPNYYGSSWGYNGHHGYNNPFDGLISMIFYPLKMLFLLATLPLWLFLIIFIGFELEDIFD